MKYVLSKFKIKNHHDLKKNIDISKIKIYDEIRSWAKVSIDGSQEIEAIASFDREN